MKNSLVMIAGMVAILALSPVIAVIAMTVFAYQLMRAEIFVALCFFVVIGLLAAWDLGVFGR